MHYYTLLNATPTATLSPVRHSGVDGVLTGSALQLEEAAKVEAKRQEVAGRSATMAREVEAAAARRLADAEAAAERRTAAKAAAASGAPGAAASVDLKAEAADEAAAEGAGACHVSCMQLSHCQTSVSFVLKHLVAYTCDASPAIHMLGGHTAVLSCRTLNTAFCMRKMISLSLLQMMKQRMEPWRRLSMPLAKRRSCKTQTWQHSKTVPHKVTDQPMAPSSSQAVWRKTATWQQHILRVKIRTTGSSVLLLSLWRHGQQTAVHVQEYQPFCVNPSVPMKVVQPRMQ